MNMSILYLIYFKTLISTINSCPIIDVIFYSESEAYKTQYPLKLIFTVFQRESLGEQGCIYVVHRAYHRTGQSDPVWPFHCYHGPNLHIAALRSPPHVLDSKGL